MQGCAEAEGSRELAVKSQKERNQAPEQMEREDKVTVWTVVELVLNMNHFSLRV